MNLALWILQVLLALLFLFAGGMKLIMPIEEMTQQIAMPGLFLRFIGVCEVLGGLGLVLPWLAGIRPGLTPLAAVGLVIIMVGDDPDRPSPHRDCAAGGWHSLFVRGLWPLASRAGAQAQVTVNALGISLLRSEKSRRDQGEVSRQLPLRQDRFRSGRSDRQGAGL